MQTTFLAAKFCEPGSGDRVATPYAAFSNYLLFVLYAGYFFVGGKREVLSAPALYFGGLGLYTLGYLAFGCANHVKWIQGDAHFTINVFDVMGGALFAGGSTFLLVLAIPPWKSSKGYTPDWTFPVSDVLFGAPCVWHGSLMFLIGSLLFFKGAVMDLAGQFDSLPFYQIGVLVFVLGRCLFLAGAIRDVSRELTSHATEAFIRQLRQYSGQQDGMAIKEDFLTIISNFQSNGNAAAFDSNESPANSVALKVPLLP